jgi:signal transduction histidine kinase
VVERSASVEGREVRLLLVEDSEDDAELIFRTLRRAGFEPTWCRVDTANGLRQALKESSWDAVIADYSMPAFGGMDALEIVKAIRPGLPFILASAVIGEERAVEAMRAGAHDYVMKRNLTRLPLALARELREAEERRERRRAEHADRFLSRSSALLSESLDLDRTVARIAAISVPELSDFCAVAVPDGEDGSMRQASASADGVLSPLRRWQPSATSFPWALQVIQSGAPVIAPDAPADLFSADVWTPDEKKALEPLRPAAYVCVPMRTGTTVVGALCLMIARSRRPFDSFDVELAQRLANRAAMAIAHARLYREAQEAVRARDDFLSVASHELRTPLTPLQLHMLRLRAIAREGKLVGMPAEELAKVLDTSVRLVERLSLEVSNLLDVSRIICGRVAIEPEQFDLSALVRDVTGRAEIELERANCSLELTGVAPVVGRWDRMRVERIVSNLLSNAMKYGAGKPVEITVDTEGGAARLSVRDHGIGIAHDQVERVFGRFERAVSEHTYGGLGLGLYIVRQFAEAHGGSVEIETRQGQGSTFTVRLPLPRKESCAE